MQLAVGKGGGGGGLGGVFPKAIFSLWGVLQNECYVGGPLTSTCTLHANCGSHSQLSYFWLSHTGQDGADTTHKIKRQKELGDELADSEFIF